ncbi:hypothetical protein SGRIM128S_05902 [Streptomyces griseomycini]
MQFHDSMISLVGNTPLVRLNSVTKGIRATVLAKVEYFNPGGSVKDRIALRMIEAAEKSGELKPGGTIVEPTSGNTGVGLAIVAQQKGYKCIFVCPDKVSTDKINVLRAYGAEVVVCPTAVAPEHPDSYYNVSDRLVRETPGAWKPDQYSNPNNPLSHYHSTGPELWEQTEGRITHFVAGGGTGGTISVLDRALPEGGQRGPRPGRRRRPRGLGVLGRPGTSPDAVPDQAALCLLPEESLRSAKQPALARGRWSTPPPSGRPAETQKRSPPTASPGRGRAARTTSSPTSRAARPPCHCTRGNRDDAIEAHRPLPVDKAPTAVPPGSSAGRRNCRTRSSQTRRYDHDKHRRPLRARRLRPVIAGLGQPHGSVLVRHPPGRRTHHLLAPRPSAACDSRWDRRARRPRSLPDRPPPARAAPTATASA